MIDKQPEALWWADVLMRDVGSQLANRKQAAALLRTQHAEIVKCHTEIGAQARKNAEQRAAIERKDALLRQALEAFEYQMKPLCMCFAGCAECDPATAPNIDQIEYAIKKELAK